MIQKLFDLSARLGLTATKDQTEELVLLIHDIYCCDEAPLIVPRALLETLLENAIYEYRTMHSQRLNWEVLKRQQKVIEDTKAILEKESIK